MGTDSMFYVSKDSSTDKILNMGEVKICSKREFIAAKLITIASV